MIIDKANKCLFSLIRKSREWKGFDPNLRLYLFDHLISPILSYGCKIWGNRHWEEIEKLHLFIRKYALGVKRSTPSDAIYAELGRFPLLLIRRIQTIKFANRILNLHDKPLVKKALKVQTQVDVKGHFNWVSEVISLMIENNLAQFQASKEEINMKMKENFKSDLLKRIKSCGEGKKLRTYALF